MDEKNSTPEKIKTFNLRNFSVWFLGIVLLFAGIGMMSESIFAGILAIISALIVLPPTVKIMKDKFKFQISRNLTAIIIIVLIGIATSINSSVEKNTITDTTSDTSIQTTEQSETTQGNKPVSSEKTYQEVFSFSGSGAKKSEPFTITGSRFKIAYDCNGSLCQAFLYKVGSDIMSDLIINSSGPVKDETITYGSGEYYIQSNTVGTYTMTVYDYK